MKKFFKLIGHMLAYVLQIACVFCIIPFLLLNFLSVVLKGDTESVKVRYKFAIEQLKFYFNKTLAGKSVHTVNITRLYSGYIEDSMIHENVLKATYTDNAIMLYEHKIFS